MWQRQKVVVYLLNPTSNHNPGRLLPYPERLYIFWILHQTTTFCRNCHKSPLLYIFWILHQTTTAMLPSPTRERCISFESYIKPQPTCCCNLATVCCISFESYIKPQLYGIGDMISSVVYLLNPTSNHNLSLGVFSCSMLYIFWILHQTTTSLMPSTAWRRCISFESYIKPQPLSPTCSILCVVYLLNPTSNHNAAPSFNNETTLYIFWILHQTTTCRVADPPKLCCISFESYIKPQLFHLLVRICSSCISFESYIKPQHLLNTPQRY